MRRYHLLLFLFQATGRTGTVHRPGRFLTAAPWQSIIVVTRYRGARVPRGNAVNRAGAGEYGARTIAMADRFCCALPGKIVSGVPWWPL